MKKEENMEKKKVKESQYSKEVWLLGKGSRTSDQ